MMFPVRIEIIPSQGIVGQVQALVPRTTTPSVTCLPHHGIERTMRTAVELSDAGYTVVPHLAARSISSRAELTEMVRACDAAGNPEGHPAVGPVDLLDGLLAKQHLASHVVTQMCFSAVKIHDYAALLRREGVHLPVWAGVAGALPRTKLVALGAQIGVGSSLKFLSRKGPLARKLLSGDRYSPDSLIAGLESQPGNIAGIHLYSFNSLDPVPAGPDQATTSALQTALIRGAAR